MKKIKHKPPSRVRYEKNNPVWSVRMPKEWIDELEIELKANGQSRKEFLGIALNKQRLNAEKIRVTWRKKGYNQGNKDGYKNGYNEGYEKGMNDWAIWCYCYNCNKAIFIKPNSDDHEKIIDQMKGYLNHSQCPEG